MSRQVTVQSYPTQLLSHFFFNDTPTTEIYTLSLHALFRSPRPVRTGCAPWPTRFAVAITESTTAVQPLQDRKSTRLNSSHTVISYAVFCLKKKKTEKINGFRYTPKDASACTACLDSVERQC